MSSDENEGNSPGSPLGGGHPPAGMAILDTVATLGQPTEQPLWFPANLVTMLFAVVSDSIALILTDPAGVVVAWSPFAERLYGWTSDEAVGAPIQDLTVGPVTADVADAILERLSEGHHWSGTFDARRKDGALFRVDVLDAPVIDDNGQMVGLLGLSRESADQFANSLSELAELRELAGRLDDFRREEARRIAAQVHDEFSQKLHMAIQQASSLAADDTLPVATRQALNELVASQVDLVGVMHGVCGSLRPPLFDELGLVAALEHLVESAEQRGISVVANLDPAIGALGVVVGEVVLAVVQEALTNVLVHAGAETATVSVRMLGDVVSVTVTDDGVGIEGPWGFGIRLMVERVRRLGGTITLSVASDGGTTVVARLPAEPFNAA